MELSTVLPLVSGGLGSGSLALVLWLVAQGKLVPGSIYENVREDRDFYRAKFNETTNILGVLLSSVEVEEPHDA